MKNPPPSSRAPSWWRFLRRFLRRSPESVVPAYHPSHVLAQNDRRSPWQRFRPPSLTSPAIPPARFKAPPFSPSPRPRGLPSSISRKLRRSSS